MPLYENVGLEFIQKDFFFYLKSVIFRFAQNLKTVH